MSWPRLAEWRGGSEPPRIMLNAFYRKVLDKEIGDTWSLLDEAADGGENVLAVVKISVAPDFDERSCGLRDNLQGQRCLRMARDCMEKTRTPSECKIPPYILWKKPDDGLESVLEGMLNDENCDEYLRAKIGAGSLIRQKLIWAIAYRGQNGEEIVMAQFLCGTGLLGEEVIKMFDKLQAEHCARVAELEADLGNEGFCRGLLEQIPKRWKGGRELFQLLADNDEETAFCRLLDLGWSRYMIGALLGKIALNELQPASVIDRCELFAEKAKRSETRKRHEQAREAEKEQKKRKKTK